MTDKQERSPEPTVERIDLPIGTHVVNVPQRVTDYLRSLGADRTPLLSGTRVWLRSDNDKLVLHLGDVELGAVDEV
jgi:hypothetical protein